MSAADTLRRWRLDPVAFVRECFNEEPEPWQAITLRKVAKGGKQRIAQKAAVGVGKSKVKAWIGWWFLLCTWDPAKHKKHPMGAVVSIDAKNLSSGLWKELGLCYDNSRILKAEFDMTSEAIRHKQHRLTWFLEARSFPKAADGEQQAKSLAGIHGPYMCILLDEIGTMHPMVGRRAEQALADAECEFGLIVASGNPTDLSGMLYDVVAVRTGWDVVEITGDPDDPMRSARVSMEWAREQIQTYGRDNPWVMAHVLGKFPPGGLNTLLTVEEVKTAMARNPPADTYQWAQKRIGVDVARFGDDRTVLFPRQGIACFRPVILRNADTNQIAARVADMANTWGGELEIIDDTGHWGHGVYDQLRAAGRHPIAVQYHAKASDDRYKNLRVQGWLKLRDAVREGLALPNMPELIPELTQLQYSFDGGKFALEDKDQFKKRLGYSPDLGDALATTYMVPDAPRGAAALIEGRQEEVYHPHRRFKSR